VRQALDTSLSVTLFLEGAQQVISHGADMTVRAARRDDKSVSHGALAFQVDENDVLGLVVVKTRQDEISEGGDLRLGFGRSRFERGFVRTRRGVRAQRGRSFVASLEETYHRKTPRSAQPHKLFN
jgi:hypothetical protein